MTDFCPDLSIGDLGVCFGMMLREQVIQERRPILTIHISGRPSAGCREWYI
jgi:hypothetical protein